MRHLHVKLRDGYRLRGMVVCLFALLSVLPIPSFVGFIAQRPGAWWVILPYLFAIPYLISWPGIPGHLDWVVPDSAPLSASLTVLQFALAAAALDDLSTMSGPWGLLFLVVAVSAYLFAVFLAAVGTRHLCTHWTLATGRVRAYLASLQTTHPAEVLLRRALKEGRDFTPVERLTWEAYLADRMLGQGAYAPPASVSRIHQIRVRASAALIRSETEAAAAALGRMRVARLERAMSQRPPYTQEG